MAVMERIAIKHKFRVLFHEKPFAGVNGSGKHNNWSMATNTGVNLLSPGKNPKSNLRFLTFVVNTMKAVKDNADLLKASIFSAGNEHRLGANEAPPAIISIFLGTRINEMLDLIESNVSDKKMTTDKKTELKMDIGRIPEILLDNTDRNRTSPFAFTGNRFEFRAVGSSSNCSSPMVALNTCVANQLEIFYEDVNQLVNAGHKRDEAILKVLKKYIKESKHIVFEGNGYSKEWVEEAQKRGLSNNSDTPTVLSAFIKKETMDMFARLNVLNHRELEARYEIRMEIFKKVIQIESRVLGDLAINHIIPTAIRYQNTLIENVRGMRELLDTGEFNRQAGLQLDTLKRISGHISSVHELVTQMTEERKIANAMENTVDQSFAYSTKVKPFLEEIRSHIDKLELIVDDELWTMPKYREMLFQV
jgi:glutamine synthetase